MTDMVLLLSALLVTLLPMSKSACLQGMFSVPGSFACFKRINEAMSWNHGKRRCEMEGLVLARPADSNSVALRQYIWEEYGSPGVWVDASGTGTIMRWNHDESPFDQSLAVDQNAGLVGREYCLLLTLVQSGLDMWPRQPYASGGCSAGQYVLCQEEDLSWCIHIEDADCSQHKKDCPSRCKVDEPWCERIPLHACASYRDSCPKKCP